MSADLVVTAIGGLAIIGLAFWLIATWSDEERRR